MPKSCQAAVTLEAPVAPVAPVASAPSAPSAPSSSKALWIEGWGTSRALKRKMGQNLREGTTYVRIGLVFTIEFSWNSQF